MLFRKFYGGVRMEARKIISFGKSSHVISLPKPWMEEYKLKKGDSVFLENRGKELALYPQKREEKKELQSIVVNVDGKNMDLIKMEIVSAYLNNNDVIEIRGEGIIKQSPEIKKIIHDLSGLEIIEETAKKIVAKDLLDMNEISIKTLIRRIDNIIRSMIIDSIQSLNQDLSDSITDRDVDVNRLVFLSYRVIRGLLRNNHLARSFDITNSELLFSWVIVTKLEKIGDQTKRISRVLQEKKFGNKNKQELEKIYKLLKENYEKVMKAYYTNNKELAYEIEVSAPARTNRCNDFKCLGQCEDVKQCKKTNTEDYCRELARVIETMKGMSISIKNIARAVIGI